MMEARVPDPEQVLRAVESLRHHLRLRVGDAWPAFSQDLARLVIALKLAKTPEQRRRALRALLEFGGRSSVAEVFDRIATHAHSRESMDALLQDARVDPPPSMAAAQPPHPEDINWTRRGQSVPKMEARADDDLLDLDSAPTPTNAVPPSPKAPPHDPKRARPSARRVVNIHFVHGDGNDLRRDAPLVNGRAYRLHLSIGAPAPQSIVRNPQAVHADRLPPSTAGHWLKLVAVSADLDVEATGHWLFLPTYGPAWHCACRPGGPHACAPGERAAYVALPVIAPRPLVRAQLRLTITCAQRVVQSLLVSATVTQSPGMPGSNEAVVDYNLTDGLADLAEIRPRALSVMMNEAADGSHLMVFNGAQDAAVALHLGEGQMRDAVMLMRDVMHRVHIDDRGPKPTDKVNRFDAQNAKPLPAFAADVRHAATWGWTLWQSLWGDHIRFWREHRQAFVANSDTIQIARKERSTSVFPWALVYDMPLDLGAADRFTDCPLLAESAWRDFAATDGDLPVRCPHEGEHAAENVICPYGFWGFRYLIEQPASLQADQTPPPNWPVEPLPVKTVLAVSDDLDPNLAGAHLAKLRADHPQFAFEECHSRDQVRSGLGASDLEVVYFYCHGRHTDLPGGTGVMPTLGVGRREVIQPPDLVAWVMGWPADHWQATRPLVFINGCHTADIVPQTLVNFVDTFSASLDAGGVIGTEITLHQRVANEVAETFLAAFQEGLTVGQALRRARNGLLRKGNLLGLVYTAYCSADLRFARRIA